MVSLRPATPADLRDVETICTLTGDDGSDASGQYDEPTLLAALWAAPHLIADPSLCTIVVDNDGPAGYLVATADTAAFESWCERMWWPALRDRHPLQAPRRDRDQHLVALIHAPEATPASITGRYPAHLHINLLPRAQGQGLGRALIDRLADQLRERGVPGVHLGVSRTNEPAIGFYEHLGFAPVAVEPDGGLIMGLTLT
ncbi:GNAT family N-acetyltransferase [Microcella sp.]|uniref:GNAT family N-acetyltransferase n=1 Tax=Microcella sp. TaxID=1913979 RepID=UPI003F6EBD2C